MRALHTCCAILLMRLTLAASAVQGEQPAGSEATSVARAFLGHYDGTTENIKEGPHGHMVIDIEPMGREGHARLKLKTWNGLKVEADLTPEISPNGQVSAKGVFREPDIYVFRESRTWDCKLSGMVRENTLKGTYSCFPKSVTGKDCPQIPGYPCASTDKMEGSFDLEKFNPD